MLTGVQRLLPSDDVPPGGPVSVPPFDTAGSEHEDLPYRVELWNDGKTGVESVLAVTASAVQLSSGAYILQVSADKTGAVGAVTVDDVLERLLPVDWRERWR